MSTAAKLNAPDLGRTGLGDFKYKTIDGLRGPLCDKREIERDPILPLSPWPESIYAYLPTWDVFTSLDR